MAFAPLLEPLRRLAERDRLRFLAAVPEGARVLEVGAGDGRFVALLAASGYDARGIEPSAGACEAAASIGAEVVNASAENAMMNTSRGRLCTTFRNVARVRLNPNRA